ncbi:MAG: C39 family peptidase [Candidatus Paceibacterota bacterium]
MSKFSKTVTRFVLFVACVATIVAAAYFFLADRQEQTTAQEPTNNPTPGETEPETPTTDLPGQKILATDYHVYQTFNNCAPAALSMALSYFEIKVGQEELADDLRPYHNLTGQNDDKSTPPDELATKAEEYGLITYFRPAGDIATLKKIIDLGLPIIVRTLLYPDQDYAHYRVVKGYDEVAGEIIQDDSLEGKNRRFTYQEFEKLWSPFNNAYLVLAKPEQQAAIEKVLAENLDEATAWQKAATAAENRLAENPADTNTKLNLAVANYYLGNFGAATAAFEQVSSTDRPKHFLWYQNEPIKAYFKLGHYDKVFSLTDEIFADGNKADSELYLLRGQSYLTQNKTDQARQEFEKAVFYNKNYLPAQKALASLEQD